MSAASSPPARMLPIDAARKMLADRITPLTGDETVLLDASLGRLAATDITSTIDLPRTHNAAVDGYGCLLYTSPSPRDKRQSRMPSSA